MEIVLTSEGPFNALELAPADAALVDSVHPLKMVVKIPSLEATLESNQIFSLNNLTDFALEHELAILGHHRSSQSIGEESRRHDGEVLEVDHCGVVSNGIG